MSVFEVVALLLRLTALFSYANYRFIKLPTTIGVMLIIAGAQRFAHTNQLSDRALHALLGMKALSE
jgi:hypothetical protein